MEEELIVQHIMHIPGTKHTYDRVQKLARLSSLMDTSAISLAQESTLPMSKEESLEMRQIIGTCLAVAELSKQEIGEICHYYQP